MKRSVLFCAILMTLSCYGQIYTIYFSVSNITQGLVNSYVGKINEALPGVDLRIEIVKKRSWIGNLVYGEENTRPLSLARLALVYLVGGTTFSYLTVLYLIYRVYQLISIIKPFFKNGTPETIILSKNDQTIILFYSLINKWLQKYNIRFLFPYKEDYETIIEYIKTQTKVDKSKIFTLQTTASEL